MTDRAYWLNVAAHYHRLLKGDMEQSGVTEDTVLTHPYANDREKWAMWAGDSMKFAWARALDYLNAGVQQDKLYVLRSTFQAYEYRGHRGGFLPAYMSDSLTLLRNLCEELVKGTL